VLVEIQLLLRKEDILLRFGLGLNLPFFLHEEKMVFESCDPILAVVSV